MKTVKSLRPWISEIYLILSVTYYWLLTSTLFNPVAITLLLILASLVVFKNKTLGFTIGMILLLLNMYMVVAMISELNEFQTFNQKALELAVFGTLYFGLNIMISTAMILKWTRQFNAVPNTSS